MNLAILLALKKSKLTESDASKIILLSKNVKSLNLDFTGIAKVSKQFFIKLKELKKDVNIYNFKGEIYDESL